MAKKKNPAKDPENQTDMPTDSAEETLPDAASEDGVEPAAGAMTGAAENEDETEATADDARESEPQDAPEDDARTGATEAAAELDAEIQADPLLEPAPPPPPQLIRKGGFFPMLLGGIAAAVIGFGAARYVLPEGWPWPGAGSDAFESEVTEALAAQKAALGKLEAELGKGPDLSPLETGLGEVRAQIAGLSGQIEAAGQQLAGLNARLTDLEKRPITEGASPAAVAAYERELKAVQDAMAAQRAEIERIAAEAEQKEANAEVTAQEAMQRAALSQIQTALDTGAGFADAAGSLTAAGMVLPPELTNVAENGVATRSDLTGAFPGAARAALAVARKNKGGGGLGGFLKTQLGARSLEPREGDDPDAVLSRAEAAVNEGRLSDAMAELDALPEEARAEMTDWLSRAAQRAAALQAAEALASEFN